MHVLGVDPSLTSTGVAKVWQDDHGCMQAVTRRILTTSRGHERLALIRAEVMRDARQVDLVAIEGPSYGSAAIARQSGHHERAGLWWLLTHALWGAGIPLAVVSPSGRAKYAAGSGRAGKDDVLLAVARRYPRVSVMGNDEADALVLAAMGARALGHPLEASLPQLNLGAMDSVVWPELVSA